MDWRIFADKLTTLANSEGHDRFLDNAFAFLNEYVAVDSCAVFKVSADRRSGAKHLCTFGRLDSELAHLLAQDYVANGFKNDPMVQTALLSSRIKVRRLPVSRYSEAYQSQYFSKAKLVDKITSVHASRNVIFLVSFYRTERSGVFSTQDFNDLGRLAPVIGRFVLRHTRLMQNRPDMDTEYAQNIERLVEDSTQIFSKLSQRERDVCKSILLGTAEKDIAGALGLALNTIVTHRRRIYAKLNIKSQSELFRLALISQRV